MKALLSFCQLLDNIYVEQWHSRCIVHVAYSIRCYVQAFWAMLRGTDDVHNPEVLYSDNRKLTFIICNDTSLLVHAGYCNAMISFGKI